MDMGEEGGTPGEEGHSGAQETYMKKDHPLQDPEDGRLQELGSSHAKVPEAAG